MDLDTLGRASAGSSTEQGALESRMSGQAIPQVEKFRGHLCPRNGHWWALVDQVGNVKTWAPIGSVANLRLQDLTGCYRVARYYHMAGILGSITGPIITENGKEIVSVDLGTSSPTSQAAAEQLATITAHSDTSTLPQQHDPPEGQ